TVGTECTEPTSECPLPMPVAAGLYLPRKSSRQLQIVEVEENGGRLVHHLVLLAGCVVGAPDSAEIALCQEFDCEGVRFHLLTAENSLLFVGILSLRKKPESPSF